MDFNLTLIGQTIAMIVFVWFCMNFIWPPVMKAIEQRRKEIADGIAAGEKGQKELADARQGAEGILTDARQKAVQVVDIAHKRSSDLVGEAKNLAVRERAHRDGRARRGCERAEPVRATHSARKSRHSRSRAPPRCSVAKWTPRRTRRSSTSWRRSSSSRPRAVAERATIARPYARAAFAHAQAQRPWRAGRSCWTRPLKAAADSRVARLIGNPHVTGEELVDLLGGLSKQAAGEDGHNFLKALAENRRLALLPQIAAQFEALRAEVEGVMDVEVIAAREIAAPQRKKLAAALAKRLGREVRMHTRIDETLLGGAIVRAGDLVIDGSLKGRIERLGSALQN